jgi:hypothetical protein
MLGIAIIAAAGGLLTICFAFWAMNKTVTAPVKAAVTPIVEAGNAVAATSKQVQQAADKAVKSPSAAATTALQVANEAHTRTTAAFTALAPAGGVKEALEGLGGVFKDLGTLSPPIAALCVALLMFLAAGGIEFAGIVK